MLPKNKVIYTLYSRPMDIFLAKRQFRYFHGAFLAATAYGQRISIERPPATLLSFRCMTFTAVVIPALSPDIELKLFLTQNAK